MSAWSTVHGIVARDLARSTRQTSRLLGGVARPFMWLLLVGTGYNAIARLESGLPYQAFVFPGVIVMAALFGGTLTAVSTVYDREFGMLRLMLASPAGLHAVLAGRAIAATLVGVLQGGIVLAFAPLVLHLGVERWLMGLAALAAVSAMSAMLGLLMAARIRSVENFAGIINVVLFPLLFLRGALSHRRHAPGAARGRAGQSGDVCGGPRPPRAGPAGGGRHPDRRGRGARRARARVRAGHSAVRPRAALLSPASRGGRGQFTLICSTMPCATPLR